MAFFNIGGGEFVETKEIKEGDTMYVFRRKVILTYQRQISYVQGAFTPPSPTQIYGSESLTRISGYTWEQDEVTHRVEEHQTVATPGQWKLADTYEISEVPAP